MGRFRALLLGVAEYDTPALLPLPFVTDDIARVAAALEARGYSTELPDGSGWLGPTKIRAEVNRFLKTAEPQDTLLVYLSGHGAHGEGVDYLLPSDIDLEWLPLAEGAVPLNGWASTIESSRAGGIVFLVDACREGFHEQTMSIAARTAWSPDKVAHSDRRNVAWIFPCSPGQVSRFATVEPEGRSFSLFAAAVEEAINAGAAPRTLTDFANAIAANMAALTTEHNKEPQQTRVAGEADGTTFVVLPGSMVDSETEDWATAAEKHIAWEKTANVHGRDSLKDEVTSLVRHLAAARRESASMLADDPWHDRRFALRMNERMSLILGSLLDDLLLTPAEAALLVAMPFVHEAHWSRAAAEARAVDPFDPVPATAPSPARESFESYARDRPRLLRRAAAANATGDREVAGQIGWWFLHQWCMGRPELYGDPALTGSLTGWTPGSRLAEEVLSTRRLSEMVRLLYADQGFIARTDRPHGLSPSLIVAPGRLGEQELRERLVIYLLVVAHRMAIEITRLPSVLVEHIGIPKSVVPSEVLRTLDEARPEPRGSGRALRAACSHPAVEVALREHVSALDRLLADLCNSKDPSLAGLKRLPRYADASQVRAAETEQGPAYASAGIRFQLDEDRVQELLMGENLYGDADLAIREIYQNSLDACRYRRARTEYLRRTGTSLPDWDGHIRFSQGIDDQGRPYIECEDNGIGMGVRELRDVFAQAGARFAELPEFLEEQAEWESLDESVKFYPNSRFGIGVLSYFMLADDITVTTCRLGRDGRPGDQLRVSIAGPGTLFHIEPLGPGTDAGTTVRLHLRTAGEMTSVSSRLTLSRVLHYSEFHVEAWDGAATETWQPHQLKLHTYDRKVYPVSETSVWWCDGLGSVLADGLITDETCFGYIVNLTGENKPELSVDRKSLLASPKNERMVTRVLSSAVKAFASPELPLATFDWITELVKQQPVIADLIFQTALDVGHVFTVNEQELDLTRPGLFSPDRFLIRPAPSAYRSKRLESLGAMRRSRNTRLTDRMLRWRLSSLDQSRGPRSSSPDPKARPSDEIVLGIIEELFREDRARRREQRTPLGETAAIDRIIRAAESTGYSIGEVAKRLVHLGYRLPPKLLGVGEIETSDLLIISQDIDASSPWLPQCDPGNDANEVSTGHIVAAAAQLGRPISRVAERLTALGFSVPRILMDAGIAEPADRILVSRNLDGSRPWLRSHDAEGNPVPIPPGHIVSAAAQLGLTGTQVADRLTGFGFTPPKNIPVRGQVAADDRKLLSLGLNGRPRMLSGADPVPLGHLLLATERLGKSIDDVARRLVELSFHIPDTLTEARTADLRILSKNSNGEPPWLSVEEHVRSSHVLNAAIKVRHPLGQVAHRLAELGFDLPEGILDSGDVQPNDHLLIRLGLEEHAPYLDQWENDEGLVQVPPGHIIAAAEKLECSIGQAAGRLSQLGLLVPSALAHLDVPQPGDLVLTSRDLTAEWPWLTDRVVPLGHVVTAARHLEREPTQIVQRLTELGFTVPPTPNEPVGATELLLMSRRLARFPQPEAWRLHRHDQRGWWLDQEEPVPLWNLVTGAVQADVPIAKVAERMRELGFDVPDVSDLPELVESSTDPDVP
ncbi:hypothetical protein GCM10022254_33610 [Actinomadura meridiana]|uniref:Caspase domain-containing protein n=1 Tax=Actinomadura meridiana TaxID=559626 RepID=A0ABP8C2Z9_9ACTN